MSHDEPVKAKSDFQSNRKTVKEAVSRVGVFIVLSLVVDQLYPSKELVLV